MKDRYEGSVREDRYGSIDSVGLDWVRPPINRGLKFAQHESRSREQDRMEGSV